MMHRAICLGANRASFAPLAAFGDNGLGGVLARLELRPGGLLFRPGLLLPDLGTVLRSFGLSQSVAHCSTSRVIPTDSQ